MYTGTLKRTDLLTAMRHSAQFNDITDNGHLNTTRQKSHCQWKQYKNLRHMSDVNTDETSRPFTSTARNPSETTLTIGLQQKESTLSNQHPTRQHKMELLSDLEG